MIITNDKGRDFFVRCVFKGDRYGLHGCLVHDSDEPMIEFYDFECAGKPDFDACGQFVSRYNAHNLADDREIAVRGLRLQGGVPEWEIDAKALQPVLATAKRLANLVDYVLRERAASESRERAAWAIGSFRTFRTDYDVTEQERNGQRCRIVAGAPGTEPAEGDEDYLIEFDDGHRYEAYASEIQEPWKQ